MWWLASNRGMQVWVVRCSYELEYVVTDCSNKFANLGAIGTYLQSTPNHAVILAKCLYDKWSLGVGT